MKSDLEDGSSTVAVGHDSLAAGNGRDSDAGPDWEGDTTLLEHSSATGHAAGGELAWWVSEEQAGGRPAPPAEASFPDDGKMDGADADGSHAGDGQSGCS